MEKRMVTQSWEYILESKDRWCDAIDATGKWRLGRIVQNRENKYEINFDGWSSKHNIWLPYHSERVAPVRMYTRGYTGQKKITLREYDASFELVEMIKQKVKLFTHGELMGFDALETTNFLRAELFIMTDQLLSRPYEEPEIELPQCLQFLYSILHLTTKWLQMAPSLYIRNEVEDNPFLYLGHQKVACFDAGNELMISLQCIFGSEDRTQKFYERYSDYVDKSMLITDFVNHGGIQYIINSLKEVSPFTGRSSFMPLQIIWPGLIIVPELFSLETLIANERFLLFFEEALLKRFSMLTETEKEFVLDGKNVFVKWLTDLRTMLAIKHNIYEQNQMILKIWLYMGLSEKEFPQIFQTTAGLEKVDLPLVSPLLDKINQLESLVLGMQGQMSHMPQNPPSILNPSGEGSLASLIHNVGNPAAVLPMTDEEKHQIIREELSKFFKEKATQIEDSRQAKGLEVSLRMPSFMTDGKELGLNEAQLSVLESFSPHTGCDEQELGVLASIENFIKNNQVNMALKLVSWRKQIIKLAQLNGWEVANILAKKTIKTLEITHYDIIQANIEFIYKMEDETRDYDNLFDEMLIDKVEHNMLDPTKK